MKSSKEGKKHIRMYNCAKNIARNHAKCRVQIAHTEQAAEHLVAELVGVNAAGLEVEEERRAVDGERADGGQVAEVVEVLGPEAKVDRAHRGHRRRPVRTDPEVRVERRTRTPHAIAAATAARAAPEQTVARTGAHLLVANHFPIVESEIAFKVTDALICF